MAHRILQVAEERGTRQGTKFYHINDGWHYHLNRREQHTRYFKCVNTSCPGRAVFDTVDGFVHTLPHNHGEDLVYPDEMALRNAILDRCRGLEYVPYKRILDEECMRYPPEAAERVTYARMRTPMRNARLSRYPAPPHNLQELTNILLDPHNHVITMSEDGLDNIYAGSTTDVDGAHHVLFASQRQLEKIAEFTVLHSDGTFKIIPVSPQFAAQVFVLVGVWDDNIVLLAVVLMEALTENAYSAVLQLIRNLCPPDMDLLRAITDFETGLQNAWETVFDVVVQGCHWHMCRAFLKKAAELNLIQPMRRIAEVKAIIQMTMALGLLPNAHIIRGYYIILRHAREEGNYVFRMVQPYLQYVWQYWVSRPVTRRRMCVYGSKQRCNNACESMNHTLRQLLGTHPNIYVFIRGIVTMEQRTYFSTRALEAGGKPNRATKRTTILNNRRIHNLTRQLLNPPGAVDRTIFRFLRAASHIVDNIVNEAILANGDG